MPFSNDYETVNLNTRSTLDIVQASFSAALSSFFACIFVLSVDELNEQVEQKLTVVICSLFSILMSFS